MHFSITQIKRIVREIRDRIRSINIKIISKFMKHSYRIDLKIYKDN